MEKTNPLFTPAQEAALGALTKAGGAYIRAIADAFTAFDLTTDDSGIGVQAMRAVVEAQAKVCGAAVSSLALNHLGEF